MNDADYMREALVLADAAEARGEVPVGALVVMDGVVIGRGLASIACRSIVLLFLPSGLEPDAREGPAFQ